MRRSTAHAHANCWRSWGLVATTSAQRYQAVVLGSCCDYPCPALTPPPAPPPPLLSRHSSPQTTPSPIFHAGGAEPLGPPSCPALSGSPSASPATFGNALASLAEVACLALDYSSGALDRTGAFPHDPANNTGLARPLASPQSTGPVASALPSLSDPSTCGTETAPVALAALTLSTGARAAPERPRALSASPSRTNRAAAGDASSDGSGKGSDLESPRSPRSPRVHSGAHAWATAEDKENTSTAPLDCRHDGGSSPSEQAIFAVNVDALATA